MRVVSERTYQYYQDPAAVRILFGSSRFAGLWALLRVWLGYKWVGAALNKVGDPNWVQIGAAIRGFWEKAVAFPGTGKPPASLDWYRHFLQWLLSVHAETLMGKMIAYGEMLVGIALIIGALVGVAAFLGAFMKLELFDGWVGEHKPITDRCGDLAYRGLEGGWPLRTRSVCVAETVETLATGTTCRSSLSSGIDLERPPHPFPCKLTTEGLLQLGRPASHLRWHPLVSAGLIRPAGIKKTA